MGLFTNFDTGGQVSMHRLRMRFQNLKTTFKIAFLLSLTFFLWRSYQDIEPYAWRLLYEKYRAEAVMMVPLLDENQIYQAHLHTNGRYYNTRPADILREPWVQRAGPYITDQLLSKALQSLLVFVSLFFIIMGIFIYRGRKRLEKKEKRGSRLVDPPQFSKLLRKKRKASDLNLDHLPLLKNAETKHMLVTGTTGSGKTNCFQTLLPQIRKRGDKALIVDLTGDYVSRYYREGKDILLNPFDQRCNNWDIWHELQEEYDFDAFAKACMPQQSFGQDTFWDTAGFRTLSAGLKKMSKLPNPDLQKLYQIISLGSLEDYAAFFQGTEAAAFTSNDNEKTSSSIRSTLSTHIDFLRHLHPRAAQTFFFRNWVQDDPDKRWVFITCKAEQRPTLCPLFTAWLNLAIVRVLSLEPDEKRRIWLAIDELPALQKVPSLEPGLAEGRKYGLCFLGGFQNMAQLQSIYGVHGTESILDLLNTKIFFRNNDTKTQQWVSRTLGRAEETKVSENISYGAHAVRDGVSLNESTSTKPLVLPEEIQVLNDLEAYIQLPGNWPITKYKLSYKEAPDNPSPRFVKDLHKPDNDDFLIMPIKKCIKKGKKTASKKGDISSKTKVIEKKTKNAVSVKRVVSKKRKSLEKGPGLG